MSDSLSISSRSLRANILTLPSGKYLSAGQNQFLTLWTRDFCHSVRGLLLLNEDEVVRNHLGFLLRSLRADGLVPRVVDNRLVQVRVAWQSGRKLLPFLPKLAFKEPLKPQYVDEHGSAAIDSNLLVLLAALELRERSGGDEWWKSHKKELIRVYDYYQDKFKDGLIWQPAFSDWQDSAKREGHAFLTNLFYYLVSVRLGHEMKDFRKKLQDTFFDGVYLSMAGDKRVSLEGNLFAIEAAEFLTAEEKLSLWKNLRAHPVARNHLGVCSFPDYEKTDIAFHVRLARLDGYHGHLAWSWLMGLGLKVAMMMKDDETVKKQKALIDRVLQRDGEVLEIYVPEKNWSGWESWLLRSERPFAWGSAYLVDALLNPSE